MGNLASYAFVSDTIGIFGFLLARVTPVHIIIAILFFYFGKQWGKRGKHE